MANTRACKLIRQSKPAQRTRMWCGIVWIQQSCLSSPTLGIRTRDRHRAHGAPPASHPYVVQELVSGAEEDAAMHAADASARDTAAAAPATSPTAHHHSQSHSTGLVTPDSDFSTGNSLKLKNIFDFRSPLLAWAWPKGNSDLEAEADLAEFITGELTGSNVGLEKQ